MTENDDLILNVDMTKRTQEDWAKMYHMRIVDNTIDSELINEFKWAFVLNNLRYYLIPDSKDSYADAENMEMRGMKILRDIISTADTGEKRILKDKKEFMETKYILNYISM